MLLNPRLKVFGNLWTFFPLHDPFRRCMATTARDGKPYLSHEERTSSSPRDLNLHAVRINRVDEVNKAIRLFRLQIQDSERGVKFLPGQWVDLHIPGLKKAGGFTITSPPCFAIREHHDQNENLKPSTLFPDSDDKPMLELAVQKSPQNAAAAWLWQDESNILKETLYVRMGGNFVFPPLGIRLSGREKVLFVAGGVGINPLISMLTHLTLHSTLPLSTTLLYSTKPSLQKDGSDILFLPRLLDLLQRHKRQSSASSQSSHETSSSSHSVTAGNPSNLNINLFATNPSSSQKLNPNLLPGINSYFRRISKEDLERALPGSIEERKDVLVYICGPQAMTDELVEVAKNIDGIMGERVMCEKWW